MIYANKFIAIYLIDKKFKNTILRTHNNSMNNILECNLKMEDELKNYVILKHEKSALYKIYDEQELNQKHSKLGNNFYTHFTSPIRRAVDFFIHMLILKNNDILETNELEKIIDKINIFTKNSRKFDRNIKRLDFLYNIKNNEKNIITYGYVIKITKNKINLYIPEYKLEEKVTIIPYKFEKIVEFKYEEIENIAINIVKWTRNSLFNLF
jgi:exoribonuclease R